MIKKIISLIAVCIGLNSCMTIYERPTSGDTIVAGFSFDAPSHHNFVNVIRDREKCNDVEFAEVNIGSDEKEPRTTTFIRGEEVTIQMVARVSRGDISTKISQTVTCNVTFTLNPVSNQYLFELKYLGKKVV